MRSKSFHKNLSCLFFLMLAFLLWGKVAVVYAWVPGGAHGTVYMRDFGGNYHNLGGVKINREDWWTYPYCGGGNCFGYNDTVETTSLPDGYYNMDNWNNIPGPVASCPPTEAGALLCPAGPLGSDPYRDACVNVNWCGYNCGSNPHRWKAYFPPGYTLPGNYSTTVGHWEAPGNCGHRNESWGSYGRDAYYQGNFNNWVDKWDCNFIWVPEAINQCPSCSSLIVPQSIMRGETVNIEITGTDPEGRLDRIEAYYSPTSSQSWTLIGSQGCSGSSCTRTFSWNTSAVSDGDYYVVGNVYDTEGGKCSGNPWGVPSGWCSCPNCRKTVTIFTLPPPTCLLTAVPSSGTAPLSGTLTWTTTNSPTSCTASGAWSGSKSTAEGPTSEEYDLLNTAGTYTYNLSCSNAGGTGTCWATVTVSWPPGGTLSGKIWKDLNNVGATYTCTNPPPAGSSNYTESGVTVRYDPCALYDPNYYLPTGQCTKVTSTGEISFAGVPVGGTYFVSISGLLPNWIITTGDGADTCPNLYLGSVGEVKSAYFGVSNNPLSWIQGVNGDIYAQDGIQVRVPSRAFWGGFDTYNGYNRWFLDAAPATTSGGVVISGSTDNPSCGGGGAGRCSRRPNETEPGWRVKDEPMGWPPLTPAGLSAETFPGWDNLVPNKVYSRNAPLNPPDHYNLTGPGVAVIYVQGNLNFTTKNFCSGPSDPITGDCISPDAWKTKGLIFVVENGNVIINQNVRRIDALILVISGTIRVEGTNVANNLTVYGMLYAENGFNFERTLENNRIPSVVVQYNPLYFHRTNPLARHVITWREITP